MTDSTNLTNDQPQGSKRVWPTIFGAVIALLSGAAIYQGVQTQDLRHELATVRQESNNLRGQLAASGADFTEEIKAMKESMSHELGTTKTDVDKVRNAAIRHADTLARKAQEQSKQLAEQLGQVKESTAEAATKLDGITTAYGSTRTDLDATKTDLDATKTELAGAKTAIADTRNDLQRVRGDMGLMSGLVATNSKDIQLLRDLGDRNIYEFNIAKSAGMQKVGDIQLALRKTDPKRSRFTVDVLADDKLVQKRDKNTNEPVQFYTSKAHQVYEVVVNKVEKDRIAGYLATPRMAISRSGN